MLTISLKKMLPDKYYDYVDALEEFITVYIISNLPFLSIAIYETASTKEATFTIETLINIAVENFGSGEIFIYVSTLLAPAVYMMVKYHRARRHFPLFSLFITFQLIIFLICILFFVMNRSDQIRNIDFVNSWSLVIYIGALIYWYAALVFGRRLEEENPYKDQQSGAESILKGLK